VVVLRPTSQLLQLLIRERLEDVHAAKELYFLLDRHRHTVYLLALSHRRSRDPSKKLALRGSLDVLMDAAPVRQVSVDSVQHGRRYYSKYVLWSTMYSGLHNPARPNY
jgi:hypothetical protein